jgi:hypothetical protein
MIYFNRNDNCNGYHRDFFVVLSEAYLTISRVALRVEQEKNLSEEALVLTQIFQAISDEATINYSEYHGSLEGIK